MATEAAALLPGVVNLAVGGGGASNERTAEEKKQAEAAESSAGPFACFVWCCSKSSDLGQKCQFSVWIVLGILAPIFYGVYLNMDGEGAQLNWGYFLCAALSIIMSAFATFSFSEIFRLKKMIDDLVQSLRTLLDLRSRIQQEVGNLREIKDKLAQIELEQSVSNAELRTQSRQFRQWLDDRKKMSKSNEVKSDSIKESFQQRIEGKKREIRQCERDILFNAFDVFERMEDGERGSGLNRDEFEALINALPRRYKTRFRRSGQTFDDFSDGDDVIDDSEFKKFLEDLIAAEVEEIAQNHGINIPGLQNGL